MCRPPSSFGQTSHDPPPGSGASRRRATSGRSNVVSEQPRTSRPQRLPVHQERGPKGVSASAAPTRIPKRLRGFNPAAQHFVEVEGAATRPGRSDHVARLPLLIRQDQLTATLTKLRHRSRYPAARARRLNRRSGTPRAGMPLTRSTKNLDRHARLTRQPTNHPAGHRRYSRITRSSPLHVPHRSISFGHSSLMQ